MRIRIDPLDTLFFRDAKPFSAGSDTWADSVFPPNPSVIYGALRTAWFAHNGFDPAIIDTEEDETRNLRITGLSLLYGENKRDRYYPAPLDCVVRKDGKNNELFLLKPRMAPTASKAPCTFILSDEDGAEVENAEGLLDLITFTDYLSTQDDPYSWRELAGIKLTEPKVGIKRDRTTLTSEDAMLYRTGMLRLENTSFLVDFDGLLLPEQGFLKLGGEGKGVAYSVLEKDDVKMPKIDGSCFKLYLSTPALFANGWLPGWIDERTMEGKYDLPGGETVNLRLFAAAIGKSVPVSGYDMKRRRPKPILKAVPPGSVYFFEVMEGNADGIAEMFHGKSISEFESAREGFGITYVGRIQ